jgi:class 3 adenylate cyclase
VSNPGPVTILFTDLVESTALLQSLGDEAADSLRRTHFQLLRAAVSAHGGEEVKSMGDGIMVAFPSSIAAISCAETIQRAVDRHNRQQGGAALAVRVGLHVGEPIHDESDYFGTAVVVAQRLCAAAAGGQILASDLVRGMVGGRGGFTFESVGPKTLKGIAEPVSAHAVAWAPDVGPVPLPPVLDQLDQGAFVGRARDVDELWQAWEHGARSAKSFVFVAGEPGVGKTRLIAELGRKIYEHGGAVIYGRCDEEVSYPFQPWAEAVRYYVAHCPPGELEAQALQGGADLLRLLPELAGRVSGIGEPIRGEADAERVRLFEAISKFLSAASKAQPIALLLDDLHWADASSLLLLKHLARAPEPTSLLIVGTYRDVELDRRHPLADALADFRRENISRRIRLHGLSLEEVTELLRARAGHDLDDEGRRLAQVLHDETEGNPFFIREILTNMVETGVIFEEDGRWKSTLTVDQLRIPEGVKEAVGRRLSRLSEDCSNALVVAAVVGRTFDLKVLAALSDLSVDTLADTLEEAVRHGIVVEVPHEVDLYSFSHALIRETLYEELTTNRRIRLHRRCGEALETIYGDELEPRLPELAYQFYESALVGGPQKAVDYSTRAARQALDLLAYEEAVAHYQRALQAADMAEQLDKERRCDLLLELAEALRLAGELTRSREVSLEAAVMARDLNDPQRLGQAALQRGGLLGEAIKVDDTELALLQEALAALPETDSILRARLAARAAMELFSAAETEPRTQYSADALSMARRLGDPATLAYGLICRRHALTGPAAIEERQQVTAEAVQVAEAAQERELGLRASAFRIIDLMEVGDIDQVDPEYQAFETKSEALRQPVYRYLANILRSERAIREGRFDEADKLIPVLFAYARRAQRVTPILATTFQLMVLRWMQGRLADIESELLPVWDEVTWQNDIFRQGATMAFYALSGQTERTAHICEEIADPLLATPLNSAEYLFIIGCAVASACLAVGDDGRLSQIYAQLVPFNDRYIQLAGTAMVGSYLPVATVLGSLAAHTGGAREAVDHFEAGLAIAERMRALPAATHTRIEFARTLMMRRSAGDLDRAAELLDRALVDAARIGMAGALEAGRALQQP